MTFTNREEAAHLLAEKLAPYGKDHPLVLAIPRGAVPMGLIIARELGGELDVALVRKIGAPRNPEYAIGSIDEAGNIHLNEDIDARDFAGYIEEEAKRQLATIRERRRFYQHTQIDPKGRTVIIVDDGIATGATMIAALRMVKTKHPKKLIAAAAVMPPDTLRTLLTIADEVVVLQTPRWFQSVSQFFEEFPQVSDDEVVAMLQRAIARPIAE